MQWNVFPSFNVTILSILIKYFPKFKFWKMLAFWFLQPPEPRNCSQWFHKTLLYSFYIGLFFQILTGILHKKCGFLKIFLTFIVLIQTFADPVARKRAYWFKIKFLKKFCRIVSSFLGIFW